jgi:hypothetical protein
MQAFAALIDRLVLTPSRNGKIRLLVDYYRTVPDPDRGYGLAAITGDLAIASVKPAMLRGLMVERMDEVLFGYSYDYIGDLAETIALVWPATRHGSHVPRLHEVIEALQAASRLEGPRLVEKWLDELDAAGRYALLKLVTGELRIGVTARLAKQALARFGDVDVTGIEEVWHGLKPPFTELFAWLEGRAERPVSAALAPFRPVMLAHALDEPADFAKLDPADYAAEWKWDGIRVQATSEKGVRKLYSRTETTYPALFRTSWSASISRARSTASCSSPGRSAACWKSRPSGICSSGSTGSPFPRSWCRATPPSSAPMTSCRTAQRTSARCRSRSGAGGWKRSWRNCPLPASTCHPSSRSETGSTWPSSEGARQQTGAYMRLRRA